MVKVLLLTFLSALTGVCLADELVLIDGQTFTGTVSVEGNLVSIKTPRRNSFFEKAQVEKITFGDLAESQLAKKLATIKDGNRNDLLETAKWAFDHNLAKKGQEICARILLGDTEHAGARRLLENVKIDGHWRTFEQAMEIARKKLDAGQYESLVKETLPLIAAATSDAGKLVQVTEIRGLAQLFSNQLAVARETFAEAASKAQGPVAVRCEVLADELQKHPDGTYCPAGITISDQQGRVTRPTSMPVSVSFATPSGLRLFLLHERAQKEIATGRDLMATAEKLEPNDAGAAKTKYAMALGSFDRADALAPDSARSERIEITRRRIMALRKEIDAEARKFDTAVDQLGKSDMPPDRYRDLVADLLRRLDGVREDIQEVLSVAKPYARELVMEIKWAESDLQKLNDMRQILTTELNIPQ